MKDDEVLQAAVLRMRQEQPGLAKAWDRTHPASKPRECIGLTGRLFGHAFVELTIGGNPTGWACRRCGFIETGGLLKARRAEDS